HHQSQQSHQSQTPQGGAARFRTVVVRVRRIVATVAGVLALVVAVAPSNVTLVASSASTYLCSGYAGCQAAGYGNAGYRQVSSSMYWRMYSGHNCTNYAAYRLIQNGMPNERPWKGGGNAENWGV